MRQAAIPTAVRVARVVRWQKKNPDKVKLYEKRRKRNKITKKYGITNAIYDTMLAEQFGLCAICQKKCSMGRRLSIDHDHSTGAVRGLLCGGCNVGLGRFADDPWILEAAIRYLAKHRSAKEVTS